MATQRVTLAKIGGEAAAYIERQFRAWARTKHDHNFPPEVQAALDKLAEALRAHAAEPPIVYFSEWIDMWSMGDLVPALGDQKAVVVTGQRYEACCHHPPIAFKADIIADEPTQESVWLKHRLDEAEDAWEELASDWIIVILREPLGGLVTDDELVSSLQDNPDWLATSTSPS